MLNKEVNIIFEDLINIFNKMKYQSNDKTIIELTTAIDILINIYIQELNINLKVIHEDKKRIQAISDNAFMFAYGNEIHYSPELIIDKENNFKNQKKFNIITYPLLIINSVYHEMIHCNQYKELSKINITYQNYLNQLSIILSNHSIIEYVDRSHEGEAYGKGAKRTLNFIKDNTIKKEYKEEIIKHLQEASKFKRNMDYNRLIYNLNIIPYFNKDNQFHNIIAYTNNFLSSIDKRARASIYNFSPLAVILGLNRDGTFKDYITLMNSYFNKTLKYGYNTFTLKQNDIDELTKIYIYLLIPQLNPYTYKQLCNIYGQEQMDTFIKKIEYNIKKSIKHYEKIRTNSLYTIEQLKDFLFLERVDKDYINKKAITGIDYLNKSLYTIKTCHQEKKVLKRSK